MKGCKMWNKIFIVRIDRRTQTGCTYVRDNVIFIDGKPMPILQ
jgi:hypothetical protein